MVGIGQDRFSDKLVVPGTNFMDGSKISKNIKRVRFFWGKIGDLLRNPKSHAGFRAQVMLMSLNQIVVLRTHSIQILPPISLIVLFLQSIISSRLEIYWPQL